MDWHRPLIESLARTATTLGAETLELHCAEARRFLSDEARRFDVIFADPPFGSDPWSWLLPACAERLADGGWLYAEAAHPIAPVAPLETYRHDKAGQVHYHLFAKAAG